MIATHLNPSPAATNPAPPAPPLPSLSPDDAALLTRLFELREDFHALSLSSNKPLLDLYRWAASPTISPWLDFHRRATARADLAAALAALRELISSSADPVERRRAASTLLRAYTGTLAPRRATAPCSEGSVPRTSSGPESRLSPSRRRLPPFPVSRPTPDLSAEATAALFIDALAEPNPRTVLSTLHAHAAPAAVILGEPLPLEPSALVFAPSPVHEQAFREPLHRLSLAPYTPNRPDTPVPPDPSPDDPASNSRRAFYATLTSPRLHRPLHWLLTLTRAPDGRWLLADLRDDPPPDSS